jgi:hypothetical protein
LLVVWAQQFVLGRILELGPKRRRLGEGLGRVAVERTAVADELVGAGEIREGGARVLYGRTSRAERFRRSGHGGKDAARRVGVLVVLDEGDAHSGHAGVQVGEIQRWQVRPARRI